MSFMKPHVHPGHFFRVNTSNGTEFIPCDVAGNWHECLPGDLSDYLQGKPDDPKETLTPEKGWCARMSAPGYTDCTDWVGFRTYGDAVRYLSEAYGDDEDPDGMSEAEEDEERAATAGPWVLAAAMSDSEGGDCD